MGDILAIYDNYGQQVASYTYDAWGNHEIEFEVNGIGTINPIRYRGYYFDTDINLYYLKSRYYDAKTGRFINMDAIEMLDETKAQSNGLNLYVYCGNNPVTYIDENGRSKIGNFFKRLWRGIVKIANWIAANIITIALAIGSAIMVVGGALLYGFTVGMFGMSIVGAGIGSIIGGISSLSNGGSLFAGWLGGAVSGFISGLAMDFGGLGAVASALLAGVGHFVGSIITSAIDGKSINFRALALQSIGVGALAGLLSFMPNFSKILLNAGYFGSSIAYRFFEDFFTDHLQKRIINR